MANIEFDRSLGFNIPSYCGKNLLTTGVIRGGFTLKYESNFNVERYIINENATILFWNDNTKTISKRHEDDKFDKELGFLFAYFYKKYKGSNASRKRVIDSINYKKIKTFLFEFYVNDSGKTYDQARKYLANLKIEK